MRELFIAGLATLFLAPSAEALGASPAVQIRGDAYAPRTLTIGVGQSVTFTNDDDDAHTVTAVDGTFDSKGLDTNDVWHHTFTRAGRYAYFCELHPFMKGTIVVTEATR
ncbi:MAG: cupredoxin family copper-binding protein [Candidatus Eremiobacteraeota bacterium]|nr:cupredoxin family copper-binding protein [Candidatus Eremiobacteraeota bacterium]